MRILSLSPRQCWPAQTGAKLREYYLLRSLGEHAELTHLFFREIGSPEPSAAELPFCRKILGIPRPQPYSTGKIAQGLLGRWPLPVLNYTSAPMQAALGRLLAEQRFDLVQIDSVHMAGYLPLIRARSSAGIVFNWHNIESELMIRYSENVASPLHRAYAKWTANRLASLEKEILTGNAGHIVCSERERRELQQVAPQARLAVIENGVDTRAFGDGESKPGEGKPARGKPEERHRILFVGSMNYHANVEAVSAFVQETWPRVRERFPALTFTIVGSNPTPPVLALAQQPQVQVTGTVPDVRPYYRDALAAVVPLRTGGGTRLKILEAMAAGVPVISSPLGAEGLAITPGVDILIAQEGTDQQDWLASLTSLATQPAQWHSVARAARELVESRYDWQRLGDALFSVYSGWFPAAA